MEELMGAILLFPYNWAPVGTLPCDGRTLNITENQALYSLIGAIYGGNGTTTFALPNLQGAEPYPGMMYCIVTEGYYPQRQ